MTRGKYAARAARRREDAAVQSKIATYQRKLKELTEENRALRGALDKEKTARSAETRELKHRLRENTAPEVAVLERALETEREKANAAQARAKESARRLRTASGRMIGFLMQNGFTRADAYETVVRFTAPDGDPMQRARVVDSVPARASKALGQEATARIERARGRRRLEWKADR